ncbi:MAG: class I SAM-dependent methyltransferase [Cellulosilyticaceae bacterium]
MKFYEQLSKYYGQIFPLMDSQITFLQEVFGKPPREVIDIACGTGSQAIALAKAGYGMTAIDQSEGMIQSATEEAETQKVTMATCVCGMLEIPQTITGHFDGAFCIGNSLVHLEDEDQVTAFMGYVYHILKPGAKMVIQIINYSRILEQEIRGLPLIENNEAGVAFHRHYEVEGDKILFHTKLEAEGEILENTVTLIPISWEKIEKITQWVGFTVEQTFGSYTNEPFEPQKSMHWIGVLRK